ncbi:hypothetical protein H9P43_006210 [Blastocladiella emersonii ATCC 22665]|nr:hypothetical protein H9P43_006210 [Blastocladiella emersonii ATCC 22665]
MTSYKLLYFPATARAEVIRLVLEAAGVEYENTYPKNWPAEKASLPFGQMPVLIFQSADGKEQVVAQSAAIVRYLAAKHGLVPDTEHDVFVADSLAESIRDAYEAVLKVVWRTPEAEKEAAHADLKTKVIPAFAKAHAKYLAANGSNGYYFGTKLTYVELALFNFVESCRGVLGPDAFAAAGDDAGPVLKAVETVANHPKIKEYLASPRLHKK